MKMRKSAYRSIPVGGNCQWRGGRCVGRRVKAGSDYVTRSGSSAGRRRRLRHQWFWWQRGRDPLQRPHRRRRLNRGHPDRSFRLLNTPSQSIVWGHHEGASVCLLASLFPRHVHLVSHTCSTYGGTGGFINNKFQRRKKSNSHTLTMFHLDQR